MRKIDWRGQYEAERDEYEGDLVAVETGSESVVQQSPAVDCDINVIVKRCGIGDSLPPMAPDASYFGDLGEIPDLGTALRRVKEANDRFAALPVDLRNRFRNSPAELWEFVTDPANADESVALGLLQRAAEAPSAVGTEPELPVITSASVRSEAS